MAASCAGVGSGRLIIALVVAFLVVILSSSSSFPASSATAGAGNGGARAAFRSGEETLRWERIEAQLTRVRNASVKTIQVRCGSFDTEHCFTYCCQVSCRWPFFSHLVFLPRALTATSSTACQRTFSPRSSIPSCVGTGQRYLRFFLQQ
jgi:hypothetical protein